MGCAADQLHRQNKCHLKLVAVTSVTCALEGGPALKPHARDTPVSLQKGAEWNNRVVIELSVWLTVRRSKNKMQPSRKQANNPMLPHWLYLVLTPANPEPHDKLDGDAVKPIHLPLAKT